MTTRARLASIPPAGALGAGLFLLIGWIGLLIPSLIRSVESSFGQTDAGIGAYYFVFAVAYAGGSLVGGLATERLGRRVVLSGCAALMGIGLVLLATAPAWPVFILASIPTGLGIGGIDGGVNGLFLDLFEGGQGRAMNLLHVFFSIGALTTPLVIGRLVDAGIAWQTIVVGTAVAAGVFAALLVLITMPSGRHVRTARSSSAANGPDVARGSTTIPRERVGRVSPVLILLALAIGLSVAAESGVSNWLVRFLDPAPLSVATTGLTLFWVGIALGRLLSARLADRFDHRKFTMVAAAGSAIAVALAVIVPWQPISIALFAATGLGIGPIYPMVMVVAGEQFPGRSAAIGGTLGSAAVGGTIIYPPIMGLLSVTVGLGIAMLGNAVIALGCVTALFLVGRQRRSPA